MTQIRIARRASNEVVGTIEVSEDGKVRVLSGPDDLREFVARRMVDGLRVVRSHASEGGGHVTFEAIALPSEQSYEHELSMRLQRLGYYTERMDGILR